MSRKHEKGRKVRTVCVLGANPQGRGERVGMVLSIGNGIGGGDISVTCNYTKSRYGFSHHATAVVNGSPISATVHYINRTWEAYPYQTVVKKLCEKIAVVMFGVPSVSALWKTKKWNAARTYATSLMAMV